MESFKSVSENLPNSVEGIDDVYQKMREDVKEHFDGSWDEVEDDVNLAADEKFKERYGISYFDAMYNLEKK